MKITEDGNYPINYNGISKKNSTRSILYISGNLGGGTAALHYGDGDTLVPLIDGALTPGEQYQIAHGTDIAIILVIAGSSGADLNVSVTGSR